MDTTLCQDAITEMVILRLLSSSLLVLGNVKRASSTKGLYSTVGLECSTH